MVHHVPGEVRVRPLNFLQHYFSVLVLHATPYNTCCIVCHRIAGDTSVNLPACVLPMGWVGGARGNPVLLTKLHLVC